MVHFLLTCWSFTYFYRNLVQNANYNCHFDNGDQVLALFLGLKPENEAIIFGTYFFHKQNNESYFGSAASKLARF